MNSKKHPSDPIVFWHVTSNRWNSAIAEYALNSCLALELSGFTSYFSSTKQSAIWPKALQNLKNPFPISSFSSFRGVQDFFRLMKIIQPTHVIVYGGPEQFFTWIYKNIYPKISPMFFRMKGDDRLSNPWVHRLISKHLHTVITPSETLSKFSRQTFSKASSPKVKTIELGLNDALFQHQPLGKDLFPKEILILGRLDPVKGHREFFPIFFEFLILMPQEDRPNLKIIGESANLAVDQIKETLKNFPEHLTKHVIFLETRLPQKELVSIMNHSTLGVISSIGSEHIGRVAEEFLLCGTPVFLSQVGSCEDLAEEDFGWIFSYKNEPQKNAQLLYKAYLTAKMESASQRAARSRNARARFSFKTMAHQYLSLTETC